jgi:hypothetical protein
VAFVGPAQATRWLKGRPLELSRQNDYFETSRAHFPNHSNSGGQIDISFCCYSLRPKKWV